MGELRKEEAVSPIQGAAKFESMERELQMKSATSE